MPTPWPDKQTFPDQATLFVLTLLVAEHASFHGDLGDLLEAMQDDFQIWHDWTPVLHTSNAPNFARGSDGASWGTYLRVADLVIMQGTIKMGTVGGGFNKGSGIYEITLPVAAYISATQYPPIGSASLTAGTALGFGGNRWGYQLLAGTVANPNANTRASLASDIGNIAFLQTSNQATPDSGGDTLAVPDFTESQIVNVWGTYRAA